MAPAIGGINLVPAARHVAPVPWMITPGAQRLLAALAPEGALFVGGCVRDLLLGLRPADIDLATPLAPQAVLARLKRAGIKAIPTGIDHGTITAIPLPGEQFELTSLRRDVATDGRHAEVAFGTDWQCDAERRDFTINALYADAEGGIHDPVGGLADLAARRVRFIGDAAARVAEDYLRVLRFFRFHARFAAGAPDALALQACAAAAGQLGRLSGERVRDELLKILALPRADIALAAMQDCGVLAALMPGHRFTPPRFAALLAVSDDAWLRLAAILPASNNPAARDNQTGGDDAAIERLRLSRGQQHRMAVLTTPPPFGWDDLTDAAQRPALFYAHGAEYCRDQAILLAFDDAQRRALLPAILQDAATWRRPVFPLRGSDLLQLGLRPGPGISLVLKELEAWWRDGGFRASRDACLEEMRQRVRLEVMDPSAEAAAPRPGEAPEA